MSYTKLLSGLAVGLSVSINVFAVQDLTPKPINLYGGFTLDRNGSFTSYANLSCTSALEVNVLEKTSSPNLVYLSRNPDKDCKLIPYKQEFTINLKELLIYDGKSTNGLDKKFIITNPIILDINTINNLEKPKKLEKTEAGYNYTVTELGTKKVKVHGNNKKGKYYVSDIIEIEIGSEKIKAERYRYKNYCEIEYLNPATDFYEDDKCYVYLDN
ncbi:hypothetical protein [Zooshikella ganghwensis]|uniref:Uncharacterized protein n=1 Tax=Zooshikella ganghwensis TaxID=202772 RepID=A0A4V1INM8_9GAMM|nr:hypothetical protein [Zooshikella ganghwensis]RDH44281.1 hypothetical protein B9G39_12955 [Zooshikella ganghwensis]